MDEAWISTHVLMDPSVLRARAIPLYHCGPDSQQKYSLINLRDTSCEKTSINVLVRFVVYRTQSNYVLVAKWSSGYQNWSSVGGYIVNLAWE